MVIVQFRTPVNSSVKLLSINKSINFVVADIRINLSALA